MTDNKISQAGASGSSPCHTNPEGFSRHVRIFGGVELTSDGKPKSKATMKQTVAIFSIAVIAAGVMLASAHAQSSNATNHGGIYLRSPPSPAGQAPPLTPLTNRSSLTGKRPLPPRLHSVSPIDARLLPSVNLVPIQLTVRTQQSIIQPQSVASVEPKLPVTLPAQPNIKIGDK
jgi:hypothetical protein